MKGNYGEREQPNDDENKDIPPQPKDGKDYNEAGSKNVGKVKEVDIRQDEHSMPIEGKEDSVVRNFRGGKLEQERYFDGSGRPYLDIDYSNHGNPKIHPNVPHEHSINFTNGKFYRNKGGK